MRYERDLNTELFSQGKEPIEKFNDIASIELWNRIFHHIEKRLF